MTQPLKEPSFTGEFFIPGHAGRRLEADHLERYKFAVRRVRGLAVLDIACGVGYAAPMFLAAGARSYDGVDVNAEVVDFANQQHGSTNACFYVGDISTFGRGQMYDLITCFETIEHVPDYRSALTNLFALLKPGGTLLISSPNRPITSPGSMSLDDRPANRFHVQEFVPEELAKALESAGFVMTDRTTFGQRQRFGIVRKLRAAAPRIARKLERISDHWASPMPAPMKRFHEPRYFLLTAQKVDTARR